MILCIPCYVICILITTGVLKENKAINDNPEIVQSIYFACRLVSCFLTSFVIFAYFDSICLWANLYDRAPTPDNMRFGSNDDRLFLGGGAADIIRGDSSSVMADPHPLYNDISSRNEKVSRFDYSSASNSHYTEVDISYNRL